MLLDSAGGGTWSSSSPSTATADPSTGLVCGGTPGTAAITYSLGFGCTKTAIVTVNALPPAIAGIMHVCEGLSTTLTDGAGSGAWSSSNTAVASVIPVAAGTAGDSNRGSSTRHGHDHVLAANGLRDNSNSNGEPVAGRGNRRTERMCGISNDIKRQPRRRGLEQQQYSNSYSEPNHRVVTGVAPGVTTITYSLGTGCTASAVVTALPPPRQSPGRRWCAPASL